jgi:hypothetical protein
MQIADYLEDVLESDKKMGTVYNSIYRVTNILSNNKLPSVNEVYNNVLVSHASVRKFKGFIINEDAEQVKEDIRVNVEYLLENRDKITFERVKHSQKENSKSTIEATCSVSIEDMNKYFSKPSIEAVDYSDEVNPFDIEPQDLSSSIFNHISEEDAILKGEQFHREWCTFYDSNKANVNYSLEREVFEQDMMTTNIDGLMSYLNNTNYSSLQSA